MKTKPWSPSLPVRLAIGLGAFALYLTVLFVAAGRLNWWPGWIYVGLLSVMQLAAHLLLKAKNPALIAARRRIGAGTPAWDRRWLLGMRILMFAVALVAALDGGRYGWSAMDSWWMLPGALLLVAGESWSVYAMLVNPHFEATVRLQTDRAHRVIETGPYRLVRHPGYTGLIVIFLATPLLLLSRWAFAPTLLLIAWMILRTYREDEFLARELDGYANYRRRVRYRLVPGVW